MDYDPYRCHRAFEAITDRDKLRVRVLRRCGRAA